MPVTDAAVAFCLLEHAISATEPATATTIAPGLAIVGASDTVLARAAHAIVITRQAGGVAGTVRVGTICK